MSMGRQLKLGVCLFSAAVLLAGCQSHPGSPPSPVAASTPNPDVTAPLATEVAGAPRAISTAHGRCGPTSVEVTASANPSGATGQHGVLISIHNIGQEPCSLLGYPVLQLLDGRHVALQFAYVHKGGKPSRVPNLGRSPYPSTAPRTWVSGSIAVTWPAALRRPAFASPFQTMGPGFR